MCKYRTFQFLFSFSPCQFSNKILYSVTSYNHKVSIIMFEVNHVLLSLSLSLSPLLCQQEQALPIWSFPLTQTLGSNFTVTFYNQKVAVLMFGEDPDCFLCHVSKRRFSPAVECWVITVCIPVHMASLKQTFIEKQNQVKIGLLSPNQRACASSEN